MKNILKLEEAGMLLLAVFLYYTQLHFNNWLYWALFLLPDIGVIGYLVNTKAGAFTYNIFHHKAIAIIVFIAGWWMHSEVLELAGLVLFGHASFDRMVGYGLKYNDSFSNTHLGLIGKAKLNKQAAGI